MFHIDDLLLAHLAPCIMIEFIKRLDSVYSSKDLLTITRGKWHKYLGITIDFSLLRGVGMS